MRLRELSGQSSLGGADPTDDPARALLELLETVQSPEEPDGYTAVPTLSSSPPVLTPYDILSSLAILQRQDVGQRASSTLYHPQPTRSGRAPAPVAAQDAEDSLPEDMKAYIEFPSDSESDDPDFKPKAKTHKDKRKRPEASSPSEEEDDEDDEFGDFLIEEDEASGDDEVLKAGRGRPMPPRASTSQQPAFEPPLGWVRRPTPPPKEDSPIPPAQRQALSPRVKSIESVPPAKKGKKASKKPKVVQPADEMEEARKKKKALSNKIVWERKKLAKTPRGHPQSFEHKYQELVVANLELQKVNSELVWRLQSLGEDVDADLASMSWK